MDYRDLRKKYPVFEYIGYHFQIEKNDLVLTYEYNISKQFNFQHKVAISIHEDAKHRIQNPEFENMVFHLGLAEMFSYWKATCSPIIDIKAGFLDEEQTIWWKDLLVNGMGQYFYENKIDFTTTGFINITSSGKRFNGNLIHVEGEKTLVPIGGGKDSVVTLQTLLNRNMADAVLIINPTTSYSAKIAEKSGVVKTIMALRKIDPKLLKLNSLGFLNGHIPYSNILFFISLVAAYLNGYKNIPFSNEKSSDEENIKYLNKSINHQYSKTFEFENKFRDYNQKFISNIDLFSFLRPIYDLQVAKIFSKQEKYFGTFRSCNVGQQVGVWCCSCPKCLSTFILLFPFLGPKKILEVFPHSLYEDERLTLLLDALILENRVKPFECVGTREELKVGLFLSLKNYSGGNLPKILEFAKKKYLTDSKYLEKKTEEIFANWDGNNNLTPEFSKVLKKEI